METQRNINQLFVIPNEARAATAGTVIDSYTDLSDGEGVWVTPSGAVVDNSDPDAADYRTLRFVKRSGSNLLVSDDIDVQSIFHYSITSYDAPANRVEYIGYNGSSGSIDVINDNLYLMRLTMSGYYQTDFMQQKIKHAVYNSSSAATQSAIAVGLTDSLYYNFKNEVKNEQNAIQADMVCSQGVTAANGTKNTQDVTVVKGSKTLTFDTDVTYEAAGGETLVAGDFVRLGSVGGGTALTDPVYRVESISGVYVTLDRPVTNSSGTYTAADGTSDIEIIPAADAATVNYGIKLTGLDNKFAAGTYRYWLTTWDTSLQDFGDTPTTLDTSEDIGNGTYYQVAEMEAFLQGHEGVPFRQENWGPSRTPRANAVSGTTYDIMRIGYRHLMKTDLGANNDSTKWLTLALDTDNNGANQVSGGVTCIATVADDWIVTSFAIPGMSAQIGNLT